MDEGVTKVLTFSFLCPQSDLLYSIASYFLSISDSMHVISHTRPACLKVQHFKAGNWPGEEAMQISLFQKTSADACIVPIPFHVCMVYKTHFTFR